MTAHGSLVGVRVSTPTSPIDGTIVFDDGANIVRVLWDDGDPTWSRRDLLFLVGEWAPGAESEAPS